MDFDNASVVITGGSRGIGLSIAKVFARETNHHLILIARAADALQSAKKECLHPISEQVMERKLCTNLTYISTITFALQFYVSKI